MRTKAIIIKKQNINEYDQLVSCYTEEHGKLTAIAKSILKRSSLQAMHLDVLNLVDFELINGRAMPIIASAQAEDIYANIKNSLASLAVASFFMEVFDKFVFENQKDAKLWSFLFGLLEELDCPLVRHGEFLKEKQAEFLGVLGYSEKGYPLYASLDAVFESLVGQKLYSLDFVHSVVK